MRRFEDGFLSLEMEVGHGLHVRQDASGDHESQHVDGDQQDCANRKRDQESFRDLEFGKIINVLL